MRIFTALLVLLLLASPSVFAETYVCSWLNDLGVINTEQYTRTASGFEGEITTYNIIHETEKFLVFHRSTSDDNNLVTFLIEIEKNVLNSWVRFASRLGESPTSFHDEGTCTVVE